MSWQPFASPRITGGRWRPAPNGGHSQLHECLIVLYVVIRGPSRNVARGPSAAKRGREDVVVCRPLGRRLRAYPLQ